MCNMLSFLLVMYPCPGAETQPTKPVVPPWRAP